MARVKKHPGRKRRIGGWVLVSLAVLVAGVWGASRWRLYYVVYRPWSLGIENGLVEITWSTSRDYTVPRFVATVRPCAEPGWEWWLREPFLGYFLAQQVDRYDDRYWNAGAVSHITRGPKGQPAFLDQWYFVLWPLPLLLTAAGVPVLRSGVRAGRRARLGCCLICGYDKRGLAVGAVCPECGK